MQEERGRRARVMEGLRTELQESNSNTAALQQQQQQMQDEMERLRATVKKLQVELDKRGSHVTPPPATPPPIPPPASPSDTSQSIESWLTSIKMQKYFAGFAQVNCDTFEALFRFMEDALLLDGMLDEAGIPKGAQRERLKLAVKQKKPEMILQQSILDWLSSINMGNMFDRFKQAGCENFEVLFSICEDEEMLEELMNAVEMTQPLQRRIFKRKAAEKRRAVLGL
jgi:hypothetical protein